MIQVSLENTQCRGNFSITQGPCKDSREVIGNLSPIIEKVKFPPIKFKQAINYNSLLLASWDTYLLSKTSHNHPYVVFFSEKYIHNSIILKQTSYFSLSPKGTVRPPLISNFRKNENWKCSRAQQNAEVSKAFSLLGGLHTRSINTLKPYNTLIF